MHRSFYNDACPSSCSEQALGLGSMSVRIFLKFFLDFLFGKDLPLLKQEGFYEALLAS